MSLPKRTINTIVVVVVIMSWIIVVGFVDGVVVVVVAVVAVSYALYNCNCKYIVCVWIRCSSELKRAAREWEHTSIVSFSCCSRVGVCIKQTVAEQNQISVCMCQVKLVSSRIQPCIQLNQMCININSTTSKITKTKRVPALCHSVLCKLRTNVCVKSSRKIESDYILHWSERHSTLFLTDERVFNFLFIYLWVRLCVCLGQPVHWTCVGQNRRKKLYGRSKDQRHCFSHSDILIESVLIQVGFGTWIENNKIHWQFVNCLLLLLLLQVQMYSVWCLWFALFLLLLHLFPFFSICGRHFVFALPFVHSSICWY